MDDNLPHSDVMSMSASLIESSKPTTTHVFFFLLLIYKRGVGKGIEHMHKMILEDEKMNFKGGFPPHFQHFYFALLVYYLRERFKACLEANNVYN